VESAVREHIRAELDERNRKRTGAGDNEGKNMGLAPRCYEATGGDPLLALALALDRISGRVGDSPAEPLKQPSRSDGRRARQHRKSALQGRADAPATGSREAVA
jgi:hypothetical protein